MWYDQCHDDNATAATADAGGPRTGVAPQFDRLPPGVARRRHLGARGPDDGTANDSARQRTKPPLAGVARCAAGAAVPAGRRDLVLADLLHDTMVPRPAWGADRRRMAARTCLARRAGVRGLVGRQGSRNLARILHRGRFQEVRRPWLYPFHAVDGRSCPDDLAHRHRRPLAAAVDAHAQPGFDHLAGAAVA